VAPSQSDNKMRELIRRITKLEETVYELQQLVQAVCKARRDAALREVDQVERATGISPRTAELRKRVRAA